MDENTLYFIMNIYNPLYIVRVFFCITRLTWMSFSKRISISHIKQSFAIEHQSFILSFFNSSIIIYNHTMIEIIKTTMRNCLSLIYYRHLLRVTMISSLSIQMHANKKSGIDHFSQDFILIQSFIPPLCKNISENKVKLLLKQQLAFIK